MSSHPAQPSAATIVAHPKPQHSMLRKRRGHHPRPVRAFCCSNREQAVSEHTALLGHFLTSPAALARALRDMRKAAIHQSRHYDPARHAALLRLARAGQSAAENGTARR